MTYSIYELKKIDVDHSLKLNKMLNDVETNNHRLLAPLATYIYLSDKKMLNVGKQLGEVVKDMFDKYPNISQENAIKYLTNSKNMDLNSFAKSFISENLRRDENEIKNRIRESIKTMQKHKNFTNYEICKKASVDMGNFHSFYELNRNNRLSLKKLIEISDICYKL